jgi:hypothetical protein
MLEVKLRRCVYDHIYTIPDRLGFRWAHDSHGRMSDLCSWYVTMSGPWPSWAIRTASAHDQWLDSQWLASLRSPLRFLTSCWTNMRTRTKRTQGTENPDAWIRLNMQIVRVAHFSLITPVERQLCIVNRGYAIVTKQQWEDRTNKFCSTLVTATFTQSLL